MTDVGLSARARAPYARYADQPMGWRTRAFGLGGVSSLALLIVVGALFTWRTYATPPAPATLSMFDVAPPAAPPEPPGDVPPGPEQEQKEKPIPEPERPKIQPPEIAIPGMNPIPLPALTPVPDPGPPVERTAAPEARSRPPTARVSTGESTWEGLVLGALGKRRRYPVWSMSRREQGVPYVRIVMDREGKVLSSRLERSCGFPELDREAVALPRRASPLPKPPDDRPGDTLELIVPVEFLLR